MSMLEFIRAESKRNWNDSAGIKWRDLSDEQKLELLTLRDNNIIDFVAVQGDYTFWKEGGRNEKNQ